jgi:type VI secretion system protein ImpA
VLDQGVKLLGEKSKDLEIAAYLIEALTRLKGFAGLRDGFRLVRELVERFWDGLYPTPDEDGLETKIAPLTGLNGADSEGTLINPIHRIFLTQGQSVGPFAYYHYQQALAVSQLPDEAAREARISQGAASMATIERAVAETPAEFFVGLMEDLTGCLDEFRRLDEVLQDRCGGNGPPTSAIRSALDACRDAVQHIAREKLASAAASAQPDAAAAETPAAGGESAGPGAALGTLRGREDAFQTLLKVAEFFRRTEPHSPVSYALEQAVRWGRMSLPELMAELVSDEAVRKGILRQVGIRPPEEGGG